MQPAPEVPGYPRNCACTGAAPCMKICPTSALYRDPKGVVDFDDSSCIGCKSCMNACPYDALYINPETNTAHKCNMCNHRIEGDRSIDHQCNQLFAQICHVAVFFQFDLDGRL